MDGTRNRTIKATPNQPNKENDAHTHTSTQFNTLKEKPLTRSDTTLTRAPWMARNDWMANERELSAPLAWAFYYAR